MYKIKRLVKCILTKAELEEKARQLAHECQRRGDTEDQKKQVVSEFKAKLDAITATINQLSGHINNGFEYRDVDCEVRMHTPQVNTKTIVRMDTGECVEAQDMTPEEMQEKIDFEEK